MMGNHRRFFGYGTLVLLAIFLLLHEWYGVGDPGPIAAGSGLLLFYLLLASELDDSPHRRITAVLLLGYVGIWSVWGALADHGSERFRALSVEILGGLVTGLVLVAAARWLWPPREIASSEASRE